MFSSPREQEKRVSDRDTFGEEFLTNYDAQTSYKTNFENAYREFSRDSTATAEECKSASKHFSLWVSLASVPWFKGCIPIDAIQPIFRSDFLPKDNKVIFCANSQAMIQNAGESRESQVTRESLKMEANPDISDESDAIAKAIGKTSKPAESIVRLSGLESS